MKQVRASVIDRDTVFRFRMRRLAIPAAIGFHITATIIIWIAGKFVPFSQPFPDAVKYQTQIVVITDVLRNMGLAAWFFALLPLHVKLYSLCSRSLRPGRIFQFF
jgi:hypothetical protein